MGAVYPLDKLLEGCLGVARPLDRALDVCVGAVYPLDKLLEGCFGADHPLDWTFVWVWSIHLINCVGVGLSDLYFTQMCSTVRCFFFCCLTIIVCLLLSLLCFV